MTQLFVLFSNAEIVAENCINENGESLEREKYFGDDEVELYCGFIPNQSNFESVERYNCSEVDEDEDVIMIEDTTPSLKKIVSRTSRMSRRLFEFVVYAVVNVD